MSLQATLARGQAAAAEKARKAHRGGCYLCSPRVRCPAGQQAWQEWKDAAAELARQRELDKAPSPDQMPMF